MLASSHLLYSNDILEPTANGILQNWRFFLSIPILSFSQNDHGETPRCFAIMLSHEWQLWWIYLSRHGECSNKSVSQPVFSFQRTYGKRWIFRSLTLVLIRTSVNMELLKPRPELGLWERGTVLTKLNVVTVFLSSWLHMVILTWALAEVTSFSKTWKATMLSEGPGFLAWKNLSTQVLGVLLCL